MKRQASASARTLLRPRRPLPAQTPSGDGRPSIPLRQPSKRPDRAAPPPPPPKWGGGPPAVGRNEKKGGGGRGPRRRTATAGGYPKPRIAPFRCPLFPIPCSLVPAPHPP